MARTDNDTWDLATSVGATATAVAVGRALAGREANPLIYDRFAEPLVRAVGVDFFTRLASGELDPAVVDEGAAFGMAPMRDMMAVRTKFFDDFFGAAADAGIRQAVILATGLDARAYRLPWPAGMTVFEVDQPEVIEFKTATLTELGARPTADVREVAIDLRQDWPAALQRAGFDTTEPAAWSAEGLLPFLPPEAQDQLLDNVTALSAPGSRLAAENLPNSEQVMPEMQNQMDDTIERWRRHGFDIEMTDLWYGGERNDVVAYLNSHGWNTDATGLADLFAAHGISGADHDSANPAVASTVYITANRAATRR
jgi:methyltransferase (TIGR00027 family)